MKNFERGYNFALSMADFAPVGHNHLEGGGYIIINTSGEKSQSKRLYLVPVVINIYELFAKDRYVLMKVFPDASSHLAHHHCFHKPAHLSV